MIAKRVPSPKRTSNMKSLAEYISGKEALALQADENGLVNYIVDVKAAGHKVEYVQITNLNSNDVAAAIKEMQLTQACNTRSQTDKNYHLVISFPHGEKPDRETMKKIELELVTAIGLEAHQRISAAHIDKEHYHLHVAINKVHPVSYRNIEPYYDKKALMESCTTLEKKFGLEITNHGKEIEKIDKTRLPIEIQGGEKSLESWIKENAKEAILEAVSKAVSWQELHEVAGLYNLEFKPRGAGLVIISSGDDVAVKASSIDRVLSLKNLEGKLGKYESDKSNVKGNKKELKKYKRKPVFLGGGSGRLYSDFKVQRAENNAGRKQAQAALRQKQANEFSDFKVNFQKQRFGIKADFRLTGAKKILAYRQLSSVREDRYNSLKNKWAEERKTVTEKYPLFNWVDYLKEQVKRGDDEALTVLRGVENRREKEIGNALSGGIGEVKNVIMKWQSPLVQRNGDILYNVRDGGKVVDCKDFVRVDKVSDEATLLSLAIASGKFGDRALNVNGTADFKAAVVNAAASLNNNISFTDNEMNRLLREAVVVKESQAVDLFVKEQNTKRTFVPMLAPHDKFYINNENNTYEFMGIRSLPNGAKIALMKQAGVVFVKSVPKSEQQSLSNLKSGQAIQINKDGIVTKGRGR